jgi:hypothetical protein
VLALKRAILTSLLCLCSSVAWGYGAVGHQTIGAIADQLLTPNTAQQVHTILGMPLRAASTWADCVKDVQATPKDHPTKFEYVPNPTYAVGCAVFNTPDEKARMEDYVGRNWDNCKPTPQEEPCHRQYHYTDVAFEHIDYDRSYVGTSDHDVVSAINAAILVLSGQPAPSPFHVADKREALLLLAHLIGDLHQPLHVGAIYLDATDKPINPDPPSDPPTAFATRGGNAITDGTKNLHAEWDDVASDYDPNHIPADTITQAKRVPTPVLDLSVWASHWASETLDASPSAFKGATFTHTGTSPGHWQVTFTDHDAYIKAKNATQARLIIEAGARLAQVLNGVLGSPDDTYPQTLYLNPTDSHLDAWLPATPSNDSVAEAADVDAFFAKRQLIGSQRGDEASLDDVYYPEDVAPRFSQAFGKPLTKSSADKLLQLMSNVGLDEEQFLAPVKKSVANGGRHRPFVEYPGRPGCPITYTTLKDSGSYPSGHAMLGWLWASILAEISPDRADALFAKAIAFGESRVVCGFHYPSDIQAGRLAAAALLERLHTNPDFMAQLQAAREQILAAH